MFKKSKNILVISIFIAVLIQSCDFSTAKKIQDPTKKYEKALQYYEIEKYAKAQILFEDVILSLRLTKEGEIALYKFADSYYKVTDYILAGYYFRKYVEDYPKGENTENAQFMSAKCYYLDAPKHKLDQQATLIALQEFELFITKYPNSNRISECNEYVDILRDKLEIKSFENAKLYYDIGYFNAASIALKNNLNEFPDSKYKEEIFFYILMSNYKYAKNSVIGKQSERYEETVKAYKSLIEKYPETKYLKEAEQINNSAKQELTKLDSDLSQN